MITLSQNDVKQRFGQLFVKKFLVMVDERAGSAEIIEQCAARGTIEWDAVNRHRAGGVVTGCLVEGNSMTLHAKLGRIWCSIMGKPGIEVAGFYGEHL